MSRMLLAVAVMVVAGGLLAGCESAPAPMVEFATAHVMLHVDALQVVNIEKVRGEPRIERTDNKCWRVEGVGEVLVETSKNKECPCPKEMDDTYLVVVTADGIRVHGKDVKSRDVFVEWKNPFPEGVRLDAVKR